MGNIFKGILENQEEELEKKWNKILKEETEHPEELFGLQLPYNFYRKPR